MKSKGTSKFVSLEVKQGWFQVTTAGHLKLLKLHNKMSGSLHFVGTVIGLNKDPISLFLI
jgi:hypothetical protein